MAVVYDEGRTMSFTREKVRVERILRVTPYSEVGYVADLLLGGARVIGGYLVRIPPCRDPWLPWCYCVSVEATEGIGSYTGDTASGLYNIIRRASYSDGCRLRVVYETTDSSFDPRDGELEDPPGQMQGPPNGNTTEPSAQQEIDLATESWDFGAQHLTWEGAASGFVNAPGQPVIELLSNSNSFVTKTVPTIELTLTRKYVARPPFNAIAELTGRVNRLALTKGRRKTFAAETLRFNGLKASRQTTSFGLKHYELSLSFSYMSLKDSLGPAGQGYVGWLRKFRWTNGGGGRWFYVGLADNTNKLLYEYDTDVTQTLGGVDVSGMQLLFHPRAN